VIGLSCSFCKVDHIPHFAALISKTEPSISARLRWSLKFPYSSDNLSLQYNFAGAGKRKLQIQNRMKNIYTLAIATALGLAISGFAIAQSHESSAHDQGGTEHHADPAAMAKHFAEFFPKIASFDVNKDGQLDAAEKESLAKALADGTLELPAHKPPHGDKASAEVMLNHIAEMYTQVAKYDANHDGILDATEQDAIKSAIEKGELTLPYGPHSHEREQAHK
jgi:hypothetical protein